MQKIATKTFIVASLTFGVVGMLLVITGGMDGEQTVFSEILMRLLQATVFVILPSFALSLAGKYLYPRSWGGVWYRSFRKGILILLAGVCLLLYY